MITVPGLLLESLGTYDAVGVTFDRLVRFACNLAVHTLS